MRMIGLIGGMSWESTAAYYRILNTEAQRRLGSLHSARVLIHSFDFAAIEARQAAGDWRELGRILPEAARGLEAAGAEGVLLPCTELPLLVDSEHTDMPLFDTMELHAKSALDLALAEP
jgi:aspartate racemase